ncbi:hypothetical protein DAPPUDRAFT_122959 [Daphnia pulex]|uniref:Uncharacterized protein n=2 Tax=Daphnia pulex TaxID=6669 RepID=E9I5E1_DAPPU|nr:hypothetical protein DAPPUDRAFT_122959 [Daphnia pulex]|eukprot:EFX60789.1 hypothetical protein DAPPUDRAFT_122959 [Daphnia pulex]
MASGVQIVYNTIYGTGVNQNFTFCTGEELIEIGKQYKAKNSPPFPESTEPNVNGYVYGICDEATGRLLRHVDHRKTQVNMAPGPANGEEMKEDVEKVEEMEEEDDEGEEMEEEDDEGEEMEEEDDEGKEMKEEYDEGDEI